MKLALHQARIEWAARIAAFKNLGISDRIGGFDVLVPDNSLNSILVE